MRAALVVKTCSECLASQVSMAGSTSEAACQCAANSFLDKTVAANRAMALLPVTTQFSTLAKRSERTYAATAVFDSSVAAGPTGHGAVTFDRAAAQYLDGGAHTFNIATNGGFTAVVVMRFTGTTATDERIFDFGSAVNNNNIILQRHATTNALKFSILSPGLSTCTLTSTAAFTQNTWLTVVAIYTHSTRIMELRIGGVSLIGAACSQAALDRTAAKTNVGKNLATQNFLEGSLAGLYAVDAVLPEAEIATLIARMHRGEDPLQACAACPSPTMSPQGSIGKVSCVGPMPLTVASSPTNFAGTRILSCPPGHVSPADSTSLADCVCAPGFSPAGSTETTQDSVCLSALIHANEFRLLTCRHANGTVLPYVYDAAVFPCVEVTLEDCKTAAVTNAFHFSLHVHSLHVHGNGVCFGVLNIETKQALINEPDCELYNGTEHSQSFFVTLHEPLGACEPCAADSYKATAGDAACTPCGAGKRSLPGSAALDQCLCDAGFTGAACNACALGSYKTYVGSASCRACPGNTTQALGTLGATSLASCQCSAGYRGPDGGPCQACGANTFKPAAGAHACTGCHSNSVSLPASTASAQCVCDRGYTSAGTAQCGACAVGTFKNTTGNQICSVCPANTVTVSPNVDPNDPPAPPALARTDCLCGPGFSGPAGGPCAVCEAGFFCRGFLSGGSAEQCYDEHASSPAGSSDDSDCVCVAGYWLAPSYLCSVCPLNHHCPGDNNMYACPSNSTAPALSTSEEACTCDSGFVPE